jgi:hypothetical protein
MTSSFEEEVNEDFQRQIEQELMMDRLLERPERKYTDVQDLVADFKLEQRRLHLNNGASDQIVDVDDDDEEARNESEADRDELPRVRNSHIGRPALPISVPPAPDVVTEAVQRRSGPQTGPKAVIADRKEHVRREFVKWERAQAQADEQAIRNTPVVRTVREDDVHDSLAAQLANGVAVDALADEDAGDDQFMREYRAKRVAELKAAAAASAARTVFGELHALTEDAYAAILDDTRSGVVSVVHIFDEQLVACRRLNAKLRLLAAKHTGVRFGAIALAEIGNEFDRAALPLLVVYRDGEVVQTFFNVSHTLGETSFDEDDVERLLAASGVLKLSDVES